MNMTEQEKKERRIDLCKEVGGRIRRLREGAGLSKERLAEAVSISTQYVSDIELGRKCMGFHIFVELSKALNVSLDTLAYGPQEEDPALERLMECLRDMSPVDREIVADMILQTAQAVRELKAEGQGRG